ncbi:hypothetical protein O181_069611 [Austropuccinia psidii MF-1]|uniref:Reverse transcriptase domain-containing protein n=1 Tax=Austropuccinia psidii MF-1 TaxID=1389203 RepID=A0A9Q3F3U2_9BASI|nr:hypothetical protein [Austropuccinia psidii MF-1]
MIKEDFELPDRLVTARFNALFTRSSHRWYIKLRQAHGHQSWTWWKAQIINKWANDAWRFKVEAAFVSSKFNANKDKDLPCFCQQKDRLTALHPKMSEFMIHRKILRQCGGDTEHSVKSKTTEQSLAEDIINILEEVTTRTRIGSSKENLKTRFNTPWKDSVEKNSKENSNNVKSNSADIIRKCHICQRTTHLANTCAKRGKIIEIDIEKEPDVEKEENRIEENQDDKQIAVIRVAQVSLELEKFKSEQLNETEISLHLADNQENELSALLSDNRKAFASDKEPLGAIIGHEVDIILNMERPYPPLLRRPAYQASPKSREALEIHIKELIDLDVIGMAGHNEEVEITTPVIGAWHNGKARMFGEFRALSTYTVPDRYPIPNIQVALTQISQEVYLTTMDALKGFHWNVVTPRARKYLRIIVHCGVYEYLRIPFGIKNAPSHFQRIVNEIFPKELSEGCSIIYIDDIIVGSKNWEEHIYRLSRVLTKIQSINMKISSKKFHLRFKELKALGDVLSGLSLGIDKNKVSAVLLKPMPQKNKRNSVIFGVFRILQAAY